MAASYSSFMTSPYYSPVFNTALFDGPFRIYFSQSYESVALKIYHLLQSDHFQLWQSYKKWSEETKNHTFILIYPTTEDVQLAFQNENQTPLPVFIKQNESFMVGMSQPQTDENFKLSFAKLIEHLEKHKNETFLKDQVSIEKQSYSI
jgi:hypothetical protein